MFMQAIGRALRIGKPKPAPVIADIDKPRDAYDEALDDICDFIGTSFADAMRRSLEHRERLESLFKIGAYGKGVVSKLTNPIDGRLFEVVKKWHRDEGTVYLIRVDGVFQPKHLISAWSARKAIVSQIMAQRAQCLKDIASVRDELIQA
jgi:hypothetical protein